MNPAAFGPVETWSRLKHPNIVHVREAFTSQAFNDNCLQSLYPASCRIPSDPYPALVVVYDYHPNAETLFDLHLKPRPPTFHNGILQQSKTISLVSEQTLWSYIVQLASAIQAIHDAGLAVRFMDPTKILVTSKNRFDLMTSLSLKLLSIFPQGPNQFMLLDRHSHI